MGKGAAGLLWDNIGEMALKSEKVASGANCRLAGQTLASPSLLRRSAGFQTGFGLALSKGRPARFHRSR
jgi:hypothetical protein